MSGIDGSFILYNNTISPVSLFPFICYFSFESLPISFRQFTITSKESMRGRGRNSVTTYYHQIDTNGIPNYSAVSNYEGWKTKGANEKPIKDEAASLCILKNGVLNPEGGQARSGLVGYAVSGAALWYYEPTDKDNIPFNAVELEGDVFDSCGGHASPQGKYHLHGVSYYSIT